MKTIISVLAVLLLVVIALYFLFPNEIITTTETTVKGDTTEVVVLRKKVDSLEQYIFNADPIIKYVNRWHKGIHDTTLIIDTVYLGYRSKYNLGNDTLGVSGIVSFINKIKAFTFDSTEYRYPEVIRSTTDTIKTVRVVSKPFYLDEWFYSSVALFFLFLASLAGG